MRKRLQIGDIIKFSNDEVIYTIIDIDTSRPGMVVHGRVHNFHLHIQWVEGGMTYSTWSGDIDVLNRVLRAGRITILNQRIEPVKYIDKFKLK